jgi:hypothetical protein
MARTRNKKVIKLRKYRDKLLLRITELEAHMREANRTFSHIREALQEEDILRAYALASGEEFSVLSLTCKEPVFSMYEVDSWTHTHEIAKELTLVYRMLAVERNYTLELSKAVDKRDYLRAAALCADHLAEQTAHDKMHEEWSKCHGVKRILGGVKDEDVA